MLPSPPRSRLPVRIQFILLLDVEIDELRIRPRRILRDLETAQRLVHNAVHTPIRRSRILQGRQVLILAAPRRHPRQSRLPLLLRHIAVRRFHRDPAALRQILAQHVLIAAHEHDPAPVGAPLGRTQQLAPAEK